jgi:hypothetical protein
VCVREKGTNRSRKEEKEVEGVYSRGCAPGGCTAGRSRQRKQSTNSCRDMWCVLCFKTDIPHPPTQTAVHCMRVPFGVLQRTPPTSTATDLASAAVNVDTKRARLFDGTLAVWANSDRSVSSRLSSTGSTYSGSLAPAELSHTQTSSTHTHTRSHERGGVRVCGMRRTQGSVHGRG